MKDDDEYKKCICGKVLTRKRKVYCGDKCRSKAKLERAKQNDDLIARMRFSAVKTYKRKRLNSMIHAQQTAIDKCEKEISSRLKTIEVLKGMREDINKLQAELNEKDL